MRFIGSVIEKLQRHPKRIVFPEGTEPRILQAARQFYSLRLGAPILLGDRTTIKTAAERLNVSLEGVRIINPAESEDLDNFGHRFELLRRYKGINEKKRDSSIDREGAGRHGAGATKSASEKVGGRFRRRTAGGRGGGPGHCATQAAGQQSGGTRQCAGFSGPEFRKHREQTGAAC